MVNEISGTSGRSWGDDRLRGPPRSDAKVRCNALGTLANSEAAGQHTAIYVWSQPDSSAGRVRPTCNSSTFEPIVIVRRSAGGPGF
jgi:hypothetical protein